MKWAEEKWEIGCVMVVGKGMKEGNKSFNLERPAFDYFRRCRFGVFFCHLVSNPAARS